MGISSAELTGKSASEEEASQAEARLNKSRFSKFLDAIQEAPGLLSGSVGFALCLCALEAWRWPAIAQGAESNWQAPNSGESTPMNLILVVVMLLLTLHYLKARRKVLQRNTLAVAIALSMTASLYLYYSGTAQSDILPLSLFAQLHMGFGAILTTIWVEELYRRKRDLGTVVAISFSIFFVVQASAGVLVPSMAQGACALFPILSLLCLFMHRKQITSPLLFSFRKREIEQDRGSTSEHLPWKTLLFHAIGMTLFGLLFLYLHNIWYFTGTGNWGTLVIQIASALGCLIASAFLIASFNRIHVGILESAVIMFTLLSLYFSSFSPESTLTVFYLTPLNAAQKLLMALILLLGIGGNLKQSMVTFCILFGSFRGGLLLKFFIAPHGTDTTAQSAFILVVTICLIAHALFTMSKQQELLNNEDETASEKEVVSPTKYHDAGFYYYLGQKYRLTQREIELIPLLKEMNNARSISEQLLIAQTTVKSHMRNIYQKLGVHSQAELAQLVECEHTDFFKGN